jgi:hypothetical protein
MKGSKKINVLLEYLSLNPSDFAREAGIKNVQNIYDIQKDKVDISKRIASKIVAKYPDIDKNWLLTGEGEMIKTTVNQNNVEGDNIQGYSVTVNKSQTDKFLDLLKTKDDQLNKSQAHIDRLISLLEKYKN